MNESYRLVRVTAAISQRIERMIRKEFDSINKYDFDTQTELIDMAAEFGLWELRAQMLKDAMIPNEKNY